MAAADDPLDELTREEKQDLVDIVKARQDDSISRRDALRAAGLIGGGALLGGGASAAALEATGQAKAGTAESGTLGTDADPLDLEGEDISASTIDNDGSPVAVEDHLDLQSAQEIQNAASVTTEELTNSPPATPFSWEGMQKLLHDGYVVNSRGQVYGPGGTAIQDALDDLINNSSSEGMVWAGKDTYDPVTVSETSNVKITLQGMGRDITNITANGGAPAFKLENTNYDQVGTVGFQMRDMELNANGGGHAALHLEGAHENWWTRVQLHQTTDNTAGDRYITANDSARQWFTDIFAEGTPNSEAILMKYNGNKFPSRWTWNGGMIFSTEGPLLKLNDPNAPSGAVNNCSFSGLAWDYDQVNDNWLTSNGCTNNFVVGGAPLASADIDQTADDDIITYGLV